MLKIRPLLSMKILLALWVGVGSPVYAGTGFSFWGKGAINPVWMGYDGVSAFQPFGHWSATAAGTTPPGSMSSPAAVFVDSAYKNLFVVDTGNTRINLYDSQTGTVKASFSSSGTIVDLKIVGSIAYVLDQANRKIYRYQYTPNAANVNQILTSGGGLLDFDLSSVPDLPAQPTAKLESMVLDNNNNYIYISDSGQHRIHRILLSDGSYQGWVGYIGNTAPSSCSVGGTPPINAPTPGWCMGGVSIVGTGDGGFHTPKGLALDPSTGSLLVADSGTHRIKKIALSDGALYGWVGYASTAPDGCYIKVSGTYTYTTTGLSTGMTPGWCKGGSATSGFTDGALNDPQAIQVGNLGTWFYITNSISRRVMRYKVTGEYDGWIGQVSSSNKPTGGGSGCNGPIISGQFSANWCTGGQANYASGPLSGVGGSMALSGLALDLAGNLYVVVQDAHKVVKLNIQSR